MSLFVVVGIVAVLIGGVFAALNIRAKRSELTETGQQREAWQAATSGQDSQVSQMLTRAARPLAQVRSIHGQATSSQYRAVQNKLLAAGGQYSSNVEVFVTVQITALIIAGIVIVVGWLTTSGLQLAVFAVFSIGIASYPWSNVSSNAKKRARQVTIELPEFADLLHMPLAAGMGVIPAITYTAERLEGHVADEAANLVRVIKTNPAEEENAFLLAGHRLGTTEAKAFFSALMQAHVEGSRVLDTISEQSKAVRLAAHQQARAEIKKMPVTLVFVFALHFIISLFIIILLPAMLTLGDI